MSENKLCANCGLPLGNRFHNVKYCLRKACRKEVKKRWDKTSLENKRRRQRKHEA